MVAIITLNYNQNEYTLKCIESILNSNNSQFKLFVIDNGSKLENFEKLRLTIPVDNRLNLERITNNIGYVGGINHGLKVGEKISPTHYLIINNDTIIERNAIDELLKTCINFKNMAIVSGKVYHYDAPNTLQNIGLVFQKKQILKFERIGLNEIDSGQFELEAERDMMDDVFWLFSNYLYKKIGGYSTDFWFNGEQADFALRAQKVGYKLIYNPKAKLWHKGSVSIGGREKNPKLVYWSIQSSMILRYLHLNKLNFFFYFVNTLESITRTSLKALITSLKGDKTLLEYAMAKRKGFYYFLRWFLIRNPNTGKNPFNK